MNISYRKIDKDLYNEFVLIFGDWIIKYDVIYLKDDGFTLGAFDGDIPIGFISVEPRALTYPHENKKDAYIGVVELDEKYHRNGIGTYFVKCAEEWATTNGYTQIRTFSSCEAKEALCMWYALQYCMCPTDVWLEDSQKYISGYTISKHLNKAVNDIKAVE